MQTKQQFNENLEKAFINAINTCRISANTMENIFDEYRNSTSEFEPEGECRPEEQTLYDQEHHRYYRYTILHQLSLIAGAIAGLDSLIQDRHNELRVEEYLNQKEDLREPKKNLK